MTTEHAPASRCIKVGAGYACIWAIGLAALLATNVLHLSGDGTLEMAMLISSLAAFAVGFPAVRDEKFRNPSSIFFLCSAQFSSVCCSPSWRPLRSFSTCFWDIARALTDNEETALRVYIPYSIHAIHHSPFTIRHSPFTIRHSPFISFQKANTTWDYQFPGLPCRARRRLTFSSACHSSIRQIPMKQTKVPSPARNCPEAGMYSSSINSIIRLQRRRWCSDCLRGARSSYVRWRNTS